MSMTTTMTTTMPELLLASAVTPGENDRKVFDRAELEALAKSIDELGCLQPPAVRRSGPGWEIVYGERRFRAMTDILGWEEVPVVVLRADDDHCSAAMLAENLHRVDLDPIEEANAYASRMEHFGLDLDEMARMAGVSAARVRNRLPLLRLVEEARHLVRTQQMTPGFAILMVDLDANRQRLALGAFGRGDVDWWDFDALCKRLLAEQRSEPMFDPDDFLRIEEYVAEAKSERRRSRAQIVAEVRRIAAELHEQGHDGWADRLDAVAW